MGSEIFHKSSTHLQILSVRMVTQSSSMLRTHSSGVTFKPHYNLAFLLGAFELMHIFVCSEENCNNYAVNTTCHHTKLSHPGGQVPGICSVLH